MRNTEAAAAGYPAASSLSRMARVRKINGAMAAMNPSAIRNFPVESSGVSPAELNASRRKNNPAKRCVGQLIGRTP